MQVRYIQYALHQIFKTTNKKIRKFYAKHDHNNLATHLINEPSMLNILALTMFQFTTSFTRFID